MCHYTQEQMHQRRLAAWCAPFYFNSVPCFWHVKRWQRAANGSEWRVNRPKTKQQAETIVQAGGLQGPGATEGQRPSHRTVGPFSPSLSTANPASKEPVTALFLPLSSYTLYHNQLLSFSLSRTPLLSSSHSSESKEAQGSPGLNQSAAPRGWAPLKRRSHHWGAARSENSAPTGTQFNPQAKYIEQYI